MEPWVQLLVQVPLVAAFMWFVLTWSDRLGRQQAERDIQWQQFLSEQRVATVAALADVVTRLSEVSKSLDDVRIAVTAHDSATRETLQQMRQACLGHYPLWEADRAEG